MADARSQSRRWGVLDYEQQQQEQEKKSQSSAPYSSYLDLPENVRLLKLPDDRPFITLDVIPFLSDHGGETRLLSDVKYSLHKNIGLPNARSYICPRKTFGKPCPICDAMFKLDFNDPDERAIRNEIRPKERLLYFVRWLDGPEETKQTLFILDQSDFVFGDLIKNKLMARDRNDPVEAKWTRFPDLMEGFMLKISLRAEEFRRSKYIKPVGIDFKPRSYQYASTPEEEEAFLSTVPDLYKCLHVLPYDELNAIFQSGKAPQGPEMNESPTQQESFNRLDPTQGHNPIVKGVPVMHDVPVFTSQRSDYVDVESDVPF